MPMTPAEAAAFRLGLEAGAKAAERGRLVPDCYDHGRSTVVVDMAADEIAAAIRALPVPEGEVPTEAEVERAFSEGYAAGMRGGSKWKPLDQSWNESKAKAALRAARGI